jgi:sec-independent protein translocase protein TatB
MGGFDFGVGYSELFVLAVLAIIVIGPKDLPKVLRTFGKFMNKARGMAREFQGHVDAAMKDTGVDTLKKDIADLKTSVSNTVGTPNTLAAPNLPNLQAPSGAYTLPSVSKDFETYFGSADAAGETHVAGTKVST